MSGRQERRPLQLFGQVSSAAKSLRSLRVLLCLFGLKKRCRDFFSDTALLFLLLLCAFISLSAPLGRLTPIEALPHTPQGTLSLDPASPLTPVLILRFISRYARCWGHNSGQLCSFLIPHSSFLTPHLPHSSLMTLPLPFPLQALQTSQVPH